MHLYVVVRGHKPRVEEWANELLGQYLPYQHKDGHGLLQLGVRPVQLYELAFPEEHYDTILATIQPYDNRASTLTGLLRKTLRLKKIKEGVKPNFFSGVHKDVSVMGVGVKHDVKKKGIEQI